VSLAWSRTLKREGHAKQKKGRKEDGRKKRWPLVFLSRQLLLLFALIENRKSFYIICCVRRELLVETISAWWKTRKRFFFYLLRVRELPCGSCPIIIPDIFSERCYISPLSTSISIGSAADVCVSLCFGLSFQPSSSFLLGLSHVDIFVYRSTAALFIKGSSLPVIYKDAWCESGLILHAGPHRPRSMGSLLE
jgi:hypothetical protein